MDSVATRCTLYPAIDVRDGRVVRLYQGDYARETRYLTAPFDQAQLYADEGARWLHLVDLDAARAGGYTLLPLLQRLKSECDLQVQTGGGIRSERDVDALLAAGADRVVIGSLAVREPECVRDWLLRFGAERLVIALDTRQDDAGAWRLPVAGWTEASTRELPELIDFYTQAGLQHLLCTDIARDGMLSGPNFELYRQVQRWSPRLLVQASGGVQGLADVRRSNEEGIAGLVLGKALLEGRFSVRDALSW